MSNKVTDSIKISKNIDSITLELIPKDILLQSVEYVKLKDGTENIVDRLSQKILVSLESSNKLIARVQDTKERKIFYITSPNKDDASVYIVSENGEITKTSHLMITFEDGTINILYSESPESYRNILTYIRDYHPNRVEGLIVKYNETYQSFLLFVDELEKVMGGNMESNN